MHLGATPRNGLADTLVVVPVVWRNGRDFPGWGGGAAWLGGTRGWVLHAQGPPVSLPAARSAGRGGPPGAVSPVEHGCLRNWLN